MPAEIICIGNELLQGHLLNRNAQLISKTLADAGIPCAYQTTVGDVPHELKAVLHSAHRRVSLVVTTGGLGPTVDDITLETLAAVLDRPLQLRRAWVAVMERRFAQRGLLMPPSNTRQAMLPRGAELFVNQLGTAPGFGVRAHKILWVALPGPPREMLPILRDLALPWILRRHKTHTVTVTRVLHTTGRPESQVNELVSDLLAVSGPTTVGIYAEPGQVDIRITALASSKTQARRAVQPIDREIRHRLGNIVFGTDGETLTGVVGGLLISTRQRLAVAESCTGGQLAASIVDVPGSSAYFLGGVVAYDNRVKRQQLHVSSLLLRRHGAVSQPVAEAMAQSVRNTLKSHVGMAITGIAGPTGGSRRAPRGTVWIALATARSIISSRHRFIGERATVQRLAVIHALDMLRRHLDSLPMAEQDPS